MVSKETIRLRLAGALLAGVLGATAAWAQVGIASPGAASAVPAPGLTLSPSLGSVPLGTMPAGSDRLLPSQGTERGLADAAAARGALPPAAAASAALLQQQQAQQLQLMQQMQPLPPLELTEYQRFVREATGRTLPLFGYDLFAPGAFPAAQNIPATADYQIGPGDEIDVRLWGAVDADLRLGVDRNGQITIPRIGTINVAGLRASQLEGALRAQVGRVYNNFQVSAALGQLRSIQVFVVGQARKPGSYTVSSLSTVVSALFASGGPSPTGTLRNIQLRRDGRVVSTLDLYRFIAEGDKSADARLQAGDVIVIPSAGPRVALTGAIDNPAIFELASTEEPLGRVLAYAGRTNVLTTTHKVLVERVDPSRARAPRVVEERILDARGLQGPVRDGDVVTLFKISPEFANAVTLRGNVAAPLRYAYRPGMKVSDLIPEREALISPDYYTRRNALVQFDAGPRRITDRQVQGEVKNLVDEINWDYAVIERLDPLAIRPQLIPFNLAKAVLEKDPANDLALLPGDVVTVFGIKDLPVPVSKRSQFVRISGEVNVPGIYQVNPGERLDQLVARAGGFSPNAYPYGTVFTRESTRVQQQQNLDRAIRRMESDLVSQGLQATQTAASRDSNAEQVAQAQQLAQRQLIAKLQTLKSTGRIALELDPRSNILPPLVLEDGDDVQVPTMPGFVGVFGAVTAETSFLYRTNFTARDYIARSGPTRDADENFVAIIRADGSVETDNGFSSGWFSALSSRVLDRRMNPGDTIFVPEKFDKRTRYTKFMEGVKDFTTVFYQFGIGAAGLKVLKD